MARIPEHIIENVRQIADIYDIVSEHVNLKKRGRNFFGLCPFHNEKTPSFSLNTDKQIYKCFGCGKGGGTINFIMDIEKLDFLDAVKYLGKKYNIEINLEHNSKSHNNLFNQLYAMHELAKDIYQNNITDQVIKFLNDRNINKSSLKTFEIGLTLNKYDELLKIMRNKEYSAEALNKSGLFINHEKGYMDRFRNRIMFPIYNNFNKPIAFGGRIFNNETKIAKYLNSSETPIYNKSKILYGMHITKNDIINQKSVIVVEGYLDLIQLYQANIKNVVSVSGTAFTNEHAKIIRKLCKTVYIAYDGDEAGINSAIRAGYTILKSNLEAKIINMPIGLDPDDWIQKEGPIPFQEAIKNANSILEFHHKNQIKSDSSDQDKINFINEVIGEIAQLDNDLIIESLIKELSLISGFKVESIFNVLSKTKNNKYTKKNNIEKDERPVLKTQKDITLIDKEIIMFCFSKDLGNRMLIKKYLKPEWIQSNLIKNIYNEIVMHLSSKDVVRPEIVMNELKNENERNLMAELLLNQIDVDKRVIIDCLIRMEKNKLQNQLNNLREQLKKIEDEDKKQTLLVDINEFQKQKNSLKNKYIND